MKTPRPLILAACIALLPAVSRAVIVYGPQGRNTTAPSGQLADSGWNYQGQWGAFLGTPISPNHFVTAEHVGGSVGGIFKYQGSDYTTTAVYDDPGSDLRIVQISGTFPSYAPRYSGSSETGAPMVVFGRGTQRGATVNVSGVDKGWLWGNIDGVQSWGTNTVAAVVNDPNYGSLLRFDFSPGAGDNEAALSDHDSGGALFVLDGATWKLAGINLGVDGPYKYSPADASSFNASLYDQSGLYVQGDGWIAASGPGSSYASSISANVAWIGSVIPEPTSLSVLVVAGLLLGRRR